jgi:beta-glucosidase
MRTALARLRVSRADITIAALATVIFLLSTGQAGFARFQVGAPIQSARAAGCAWMRPHQSAAARATELLKAMTLTEKITMVHQAEPIWEHYGAAGYIPGNATLCIPDLVLNDAGQGVGDQEINTTAFPAPIAQTASWDSTLQNRFGQSLGWEAWHKGINVQLAPGMNIARTPLNGRNWEYMGEDPYLAGRVAIAEVRGIQSQHVVATLKHYPANNQETNRSTVSAQISSRTLHEIYLPPFEAAVRKGHAGSVMCAYNKVDGVYSCENRTMLTTYLKQEFGFSGFVMTDWGAQHSTVAAADAGLDMEMNATPGTYFGSALQTAVQKHQVSMARFNDMVYRILFTMFRVGLFDHPAAAEPQAYWANTATPSELDVARQVAESGIVLLKNTAHALPLSRQGLKILLVGKPASTPQMVYNGWGSGHIPEAGVKGDVVSPLQAVTQAGLASNDVVTYSDGSQIQDAATAAKLADVVIVFGYDSETEGVDRPSLSLDDDAGICAGITCTYQATKQNELISAVAAANPNTIVVLNTGGPVIMPWLSHVKAVLEAWYPGQEDGNALAPILFGSVNPSGKLPQTFPASQSQLPTRTPLQYPGVNNKEVYSDGLLVGYRWFDARHVTPLFCFGHGLSYTTFRYSHLRVAGAGPSRVTVSFRLRNTGGRSGAEVPQLYVGFPKRAGEPPLQLKAYGKVYLQPGASQTVTLALDKRSFSYWKPDTGWTVAPGTYRIRVGSSSCDLRLSGSVRLG